MTKNKPNATTSKKAILPPRKGLTPGKVRTVAPEQPKESLPSIAQQAIDATAADVPFQVRDKAYAAADLRMSEKGRRLAFKAVIDDYIANRNPLAIGQRFGEPSPVDQHKEASKAKPIERSRYRILVQKARRYPALSGSSKRASIDRRRKLARKELEERAAALGVPTSVVAEGDRKATEAWEQEGGLGSKPAAADAAFGRVLKAWKDGHMAVAGGPAATPSFLRELLLMVESKENLNLVVTFEDLATVKPLSAMATFALKELLAQAGRDGLLVCEKWTGVGWGPATYRLTEKGRAHTRELSGAVAAPRSSASLGQQGRLARHEGVPADVMADAQRAADEAQREGNKRKLMSPERAKRARAAYAAVIHKWKQAYDQWHAPGGSKFGTLPAERAAEQDVPRQGLPLIEQRRFARADGAPADVLERAETASADALAEAAKKGLQAPERVGMSRLAYAKVIHEWMRVYGEGNTPGAPSMKPAPAKPPPSAPPASFTPQSPFKTLSGESAPGMADLRAESQLIALSEAQMNRIARAGMNALHSDGHVEKDCLTLMTFSVLRSKGSIVMTTTWVVPPKPLDTAKLDKAVGDALHKGLASGKGEVKPTKARKGGRK